MPEKIAFSVINDYTGDRRIQRIAGYLRDSGVEVSIICRGLPDSLPVPVTEFPYPIYRMRLLFNKGKLFYLEFTLRLFLKLLFFKADTFVANDLDTLLPNFLVSKIRRKKLIYDSHEYYTESPEIIHRPLVQKIWLKIERWIFPKLKQAYTVNNSIAKIYSELYHIPVKVVRNLPLRRERPIYRYEQKRKESILIYQGALNLGRGIELMIEAMKYLPEYQLWIVGKGDVEAKLKAMAKGRQNVHFYGFQKPSDLIFFTEKALLGMSLEEDLGMNYHYASPNKIVDYIQSGIPCLCSDLPEMRSLVLQYKTGAILPASERNPEALALKIKSITENRESYFSLYQNCVEAAEELCWEKEKAKLNLIFSLKE